MKSIQTLILCFLLFAGGLSAFSIPGFSAYTNSAQQTAPYPAPGPQIVYPQPAGNNSNTGQNSTIWDRFATNFKKDVTANSLAVIILVLMIVSLLTVVTILIRTILAENPIPLEIKIPAWIIPALIVAGIGIAVYMSFIEVSHKPALCGPVGNCNTVQNSSYAKILGVLPVGVLGVIGYSAILIAWVFWSFGSKKLHGLGTTALWGLSLFGVVFSIYLTFLEPFVIGAACIWCLSSAIVITILLWVTTPGFQASLAAEDDLSEDQFDISDGPPLES